jgi:TPR repeat protein
MFTDGYDVDGDYSNVIKWLCKAAERGHVKSQYHLGLMYAEGLGVLLNYEEAYFWLLIASANGHEESVESRDSIGRKLSKGQRDRVRKRIEKWLVEHEKK